MGGEKHPEINFCLRPSSYSILFAGVRPRLLATQLNG